MNGEVIVTQDVAAAFGELAEEAFQKRPDRERFTIAFGGGSTARSCYESLVNKDIDWSLVTAVWGDERCVPLDHEDSNYRIAKEVLFDNCPPLAAVHPMRCEQDGAVTYGRIIEQLLPLDLVHLGMGDDGHTLSLFPGSPALDETSLLAIETGDEYHKHPRMTLTFKAIENSNIAVFTVVGESKREMFERIRGGEHFPAGRIAAARVVWLVDPAAAGQ